MPIVAALSALIAAGCGARTSLSVSESSGACAAEDEPCGAAADCCGGQCTGGICAPALCAPGEAPVVLVSGPDRLAGLLAREDHVYFTHYGEEGAVLRVPKTGGAAEVLAPEGRWTESLAADETSLYFMDGDRVARVSKDGGEVTTLATQQDGSIAIVVDQVRAYWINPSDEVVRSVSKSGGAPEVLVNDPDLLAEMIPHLVADDTTLYWSASGLWSIPGFHATAKQGGGGLTTIDAAATSHMAVDETRLFWIDEGDYEEKIPSFVMRARKDGSERTALAEFAYEFGDVGPGMPQDETHVYWTYSQARRLMKVPKAGGAPVELFDNPYRIESFAVDASCVYLVSTRPADPGGAPESSLVRVPRVLPGE
jgi:hypothetical protein